MKTVLVTGGSSLIGKQLIPLLESKGYNILHPTHEKLDLLDYDSCAFYIADYEPNYCIHLAGYNGGIQFNKEQPAKIYCKTATMALNILNACQQNKVEKVLSVLPSCAYSFDKPYLDVRIPRDVLNEKDFEDGQPHPSVACHGNSKRILFDYSRVLNHQFGLNAVCCVLNNCFGPGARYDEPDRLKVADSLIRKFVLAKRNNLPNVTLFGTGSPKRELMYCRDAAEGIAFVFENYNDVNEVINIGPGTELSIKALAWAIRDLVKYKGDILWDATAGDGQMRKLLDCSKIADLGWKPSWSILDSLHKTIEWYENRSNAL